MCSSDLEMGGTPDMLFIIDTNKESIAVQEARKRGIPIVAVLDSNSDPDGVDFPIPGNDDAIRANELMSRVICEAVIEGRFIAEKSGNRAVVASAPVTRTPQEQAEFDAQQEAARKSAAAAQAERDARVAQAGEKAEG